MKKVTLIILAIFSFSTILYSSYVDAQTPQPAHITVYYFHGDARCVTCKKLEQYTKEAVEANFKDELASGKLEFKVVNVEEKGKEHYVNDYGLYTKTVILSLSKDGEEVKWANLDKIWEYVGDKTRFIDYVSSGVADMLKEAV